MKYMGFGKPIMLQRRDSSLCVSSREMHACLPWRRQFVAHSRRRRDIGDRRIHSKRDTLFLFFREILERSIGMEPRERDLERLIPMHKSGASPRDVVLSVPPSPLASPIHVAGREAIYKVIRSWASKKFMTGCVILLPIAITFYFTWWFIHFVDGFFSPIYTHLGINMFGLGFVTSITFIFMVGVFMSSWLGASVLSIGEWIIKKMPLISYIYSASKQISGAISPDQSTGAFKEVAIIRHPHMGEYAFGFITSTVILRGRAGGEELCCVYVPTNHLYLGDIFLISSKDIIRPNLSVREGIEIVISGGMSIPQVLTTLDSETIHRSVVGTFAMPPV